RQARELPESIRELERYDFVVVSDVPAEAVSLTQQEAIESYVRDLGGGFLFAGGEAGYGLGGWAHTTVERILPVRMDSEKQRDEPQVAMALVIDRSGSMSGLPLEMAKAAARATADTLSGEDLLEVIAFDSQPTRIVRMTAAKHRARIQNDIARIQPGGGTEIFGALDAAYQSLTVARARRPWPSRGAGRSSSPIGRWRAPSRRRARRGASRSPCAPEARARSWCGPSLRGRNRSRRRRRGSRRRGPSRRPRWRLAARARRSRRVRPRG
ncbi:VWA domain-containing protein, partial [bacterium]